MIIRVNWFKPTGKWAYGGNVEITDETYIFNDNFKQQIVDNQKELVETWTESDYFVLTQNHPADDLSPNFKGFHNHLFMPGSFKGIRKKNTECFIKQNI